MEIKEHFYADDPRRGPEDSWTTLPGVNYHFLGNGLIQAAVQVCGTKKGTPVGLLIMDPDRLGPKSRAVSFDPTLGLEPTLLLLELDGRRYSPHAGKIKFRWTQKNGVPAVEVGWRIPALAVKETFYCPERDRPRLVREIGIRNLHPRKTKAVLRTGLPDQRLRRKLELQGRKERRLFIEYRLAGTRRTRHALASWCPPPRISAGAKRYWQKASSIHFSSPLLDHFYRCALFQLQANIAASGKLDGSIWQYNREWTRDLSMVALGLILSGQFEAARTVLDRLFSRFVTASGDSIDSSERRPAEECELDQNGALLFALETYVLWTADRTLLKKHWKKVSVAAEFPLQKPFRHARSGLLHNRREFWERHAAHGIEDGIELAHQLWVSMGLSSASRLALLLGHKVEAERWETAAKKLKKAMLADVRFGLVHDGAFTKRRKTNGAVQLEVKPRPASGLPTGVPLFDAGRHLLNPDTSSVLPLAWEFVPPRCKLSRQTLSRVEELWNQRWKGGGYGRYHVTSEPDSPGPWAFPSLFVARAYLEAGNDTKVWRILRWLGRAPGAKAGSWFEFYGPRPVPPYPQVGIVPWNWAEMLILFIHHLAGVRPERESVRLRPRLLSGLTGFGASIRLRDFRIHLEVHRAGRKDRPKWLVNGRPQPYSEEGLRFPYSHKDMRIKGWIPVLSPRIKI
jgi:hypothetical protein